MQFTAHLDDIDGFKKLNQAKKQATNEERSFKLDIQAGAIVSAKNKHDAVEQNGFLPIKKGSKNKAEKPAEPVGELNAQAAESVFNKENIKFVLTRVLASLLIFVVGYVFINWSALSELFQYRFGSHQAAEQVVPTDNGSTDLSMLTDQNQKIPPLNLQIMPPDMRIVIPKIDRNVPVVPVPTANLVDRDWGALEKDIQRALQDGVVHYPGTAYPDQIGNVVITGHSSYFPWDPGRFKDVFALLHDLKLKDEIIVYYEQKKFVYQVDEIKVVTPDKIDVLGPSEDSRLTLITCTPVGTNQKRLIVRAKLVEGVLADGTKVERL